ncbi:hypothetical protein [Streptomyces sp. SP18CM02]|uniref:hypothetical protein n=1 Tax=Streptomyces sp. SP18CM02 TaxID=2758571 RepID=UPI00168A8EE1|nr:hypothetical protein [Streptomyces sp. SP18CM02]MBD3550856.1 hypothetical protein [Streptomyces sp. SP18CM02]
MNDRLNPSNLPPFVTFETGAKLLVDLKIARHATGDTVRYIARTREDWPFGEGDRLPYIAIGNARTMETGAFLDYFRKNPPTSAVRGPDKKPRVRRARQPGGES